MAEGTKHLHAQRSFRFSAERRKTLAKRPAPTKTDYFAFYES